MTHNMENNFTNDEPLIQWFYGGAIQGNAERQYKLGKCYVESRGVPRDYKKAVYWYRKAAEQGHTGAQYQLGVSFVRGQGVQQDYQKSYMWYLLARENGGVEGNDDFVRGYIDFFESKLSHTEIMVAKKEAAQRQEKIEIIKQLTPID